jgi:hypothetical protein
LMTQEMGKTFSAAKAEVVKCAGAGRFYAENAERFLADEPVDANAVGAGRAYTRYQPLLVGSDAVERIVGDPRVQAATLTAARVPDARSPQPPVAT